MNKLFYGLIVILFFSVACDDVQVVEKPIISRFTTTFPEKGMNFSRAVNGKLNIKIDSNIYEFNVDYYRADRTTVITDNNGNELYNGPVCKYRGLYFFQQLTNDSLYWFSAVEINNNSIKGFLDFENQMKWLDDTLDYYMQPNIEQPEFLTTCNENIITIITDKKVMINLYTKILEEMETFELVEIEAVEEDNNLDSNNNKTAPVVEIEKEIITSFLPNPVVDIAKVTFSDKSKYKFFVTDIKGNVRIDERCKCNEIDLNAAELESGTYVFTVIDLKSKNKQVLQFIKE